MIYGLPWTSWLLILAPVLIGLPLALRFWHVHRDEVDNGV